MFLLKLKKTAKLFLSAFILVVCCTATALAQYDKDIRLDDLYYDTTPYSEQNDDEIYRIVKNIKTYNTLYTHIKQFEPDRKKPLKTGADGLGNQYFKALTKRLVSYRFDLDKSIDTESHIPLSEQFDVYKWEVKKIEFIQRAMLYKGLLNSCGEIYRKTPLSKSIKRIEKKVSKYFIMEYSKSKDSDKAAFYKPGTLTDAVREEEKDYRLAFSTFFSPDEETLHLDLSVNLKFQYHNTISYAEYSIRQERTTLSFSNEYLNDALGADLGYYVIRHKNNQLINLFKLKFTY